MASKPPGTKWSQGLLPVALFLLSLAGAAALIASKPSADRRPAVAPLPVVRVQPAVPRDIELVVEAQGTVAPRTESALVPEISGRLIWAAEGFTPGGFFDEGDLLLRIDPSDAEIELARSRARLERAEAELAFSESFLVRQSDLHDSGIASPAALDIARLERRVNLAKVAEQRAAVRRAEHDLERTELRAPYPGRVREKYVDVGQFVSRGVAIALLYAVDAVEVPLPIPDEALAHLDMPPLFVGNGDAMGPRVRLTARYASEEHEWWGAVVRVEGEIDPKTRMVTVVARVEDPYGLGSTDGRAPLVPGLFVDAEIQGRTAHGIAALPRSALHGSSAVFVVDASNRLRRRDLELLRTGNEILVRSGLEPGERVCITPLDAPVEGMRVQPVEVDAVPYPLEPRTSPAPPTRQNPEGG